MSDEGEGTPTPITRADYIERLIDGAFVDALEMEAGFDIWVHRHQPVWQQLGRDESWIRQRVDLARNTYTLIATMVQKGMPQRQQRQFLRQMFGALPDEILNKMMQDYPQEA